MYLYYAKAEYFKNPSGSPAIGPITARPMNPVSYHIGCFLDTIEIRTRENKRHHGAVEKSSLGQQISVVTQKLSHRSYNREAGIKQASGRQTKYN